MKKCSREEAKDGVAGEKRACSGEKESNENEEEDLNESNNSKKLRLV